MTTLITLSCLSLYAQRSIIGNPPDTPPPYLPCLISRSGDRYGVVFSLKENTDYEMDAGKSFEQSIETENRKLNLRFKGATSTPHRIGFDQRISKVLGWSFIKQNNVCFDRRTGEVTLVEDQQIPPGIFRVKVDESNGYPIVTVGGHRALISTHVFGSYNLTSDSRKFNINQFAGPSGNANAVLTASLIEISDIPGFQFLNFLLGENQKPFFTFNSIGSERVFYDNKSQEIVFETSFKYGIEQILAPCGLFFTSSEDSTSLAASKYFGVLPKGIEEGATLFRINGESASIYQKMSLHEILESIESGKVIRDISYKLKSGRIIKLSVQKPVSAN